MSFRLKLAVKRVSHARLPLIFLVFFRLTKFVLLLFSKKVTKARHQIGFSDKLKDLTYYRTSVRHALDFLFHTT
jgi:hypothetical protein